MSDRRWRHLLNVRLVLVLLVVLGLTGITTASEVTAMPRSVWASVVGGYLLVVVVVEASRRHRASHGAALMMPLMLLDGLLLSVVLSASGGVGSPLEVLVLLHVVALATVASGRAGFEAALWHATLLYVATEPGRMGATTGHLAAYVVVGAVVAAFASADGRAAGRERERLTAEVRLLARLEPAVSTEESCEALASQAVRSGFNRAAVLVAAEADVDVVVGAVTDGGGPPLLVAARTTRPPGSLLALVDEAEPALLVFLDAGVDPLLDRLLPGAMNLVAVPILADGRTVGAAVAEWRPGRRSRIPEMAVVHLQQDAAHCGLALRAVLMIEQIEQRSRLDLLTGLANRRGFDEALDRELSSMHRSGSPMSLILLDLDHFKVVNDTQGHQAGDGVLAAVGGAIGRVAGAHDLAARIGGDEFAVVLPDCGTEAAGVVAERALAAVAAEVGRHGVTASAGVATAPGHGQTRGALVRAADEALYAAKSAGRNRVVLTERRETAGEPVLVLDRAGDRRRPHRRGDLRVRVTHPAGREA